MINWFLRLSKSGQIAVGTISVHFLLIAVLTGQHLITTPPRKQRKITVNTIRVAAPHPSQVVAKQAVKPAPVVHAPVVQAPVVSKSNVKPALQAKPVSPKPSVKPSKASKPIESKKVPTKQETALLKEIEQNIASIAAPKPTKKTELAVPSLSIPDSRLDSLPEEIFEEIHASPVEKLSQFLQQALQLPEFGAVRVQLSVDRLGKLQAFEVLDAKSEKNAQFLKNQLPELQFPCLNEAVSLTIVFSNEL